MSLLQHPLFFLFSFSFSISDHISEHIYIYIFVFGLGPILIGIRFIGIEILVPTQVTHVQISTGPTGTSFSFITFISHSIFFIFLSHSHGYTFVPLVLSSPTFFLIVSTI